MKSKSLYTLIFILFVSSKLIGQSSVFYDAQYLRQFIEDGVFDPDAQKAQSSLEEQLRVRLDELAKLNTKDSIEKKLLKFKIEQIEKAKLDTIASILKRYSLLKDNEKLDGSTPKGISDNDFLNDYEWAGLTQGKGTSTNRNANSVFSSIGGLNVTNLADGLAKFLVERTKQELSIAFFQKFKTELNNSQELQSLFPTTIQVLNTIDNEIYMFDAYINTLRESFISDLLNMYAGFKTLSNLPIYKAYFENHPELYTLVVNSFYLVDQYSKGVHPGSTLAALDVNDIRFKDAVLQQNFRSGILVTQLFSESFRSNGTSRYWISGDSLDLLRTDPVLRNIYFGLIYQKSENINFIVSGHPKNFQTILTEAKSTADSLNKYVIFVKLLNADAIEIEEFIQATKTKPKSEINYIDYYNIFNSSLNLLQDGLTFIDLPKIHLGELEKEIKIQSQKWLSVARNGGTLFVNVRTKNYSGAIINIVSTLNTLFPEVTPPSSSPLALNKAQEEKIDEFIKGHEVYDSREVNTFISGTLAIGAESQAAANNYIKLRFEFKFADRNQKLRSLILKYGAFVAAIAEAKNSDEVKAAIEAAALPAGSASIKRNTNFNISLNAFVGINTGYEAKDENKKNDWKYYAGITAPVGVAFSWGNLWKSKKAGGKSLGFFVPLVDIGSLVSYRFGDDTSTIVPQIKLENIISPGLYFHLGFGKCPISLLAGAQIAPSLRKVTTDNLTIGSKLYTRVGVTLAVDIPLLNVYTRTYRNRE